MSSLVSTTCMHTALAALRRVASGVAPLEESWLVVPSAGMRDDIIRGLAEEDGIAAGVHIRTARQLLEAVFTGRAPEERDFTRTLAWTVHACLTEAPVLRALPQVWRDRLTSGEDALSQWSLAVKAARALEDALTYRGPEWLSACGNNRHFTFLSALWQQSGVRALTGHQLGGRMAVQPDDRAVRKCVEGFMSRWPRVACVGVLLSNSLPPLHVRLLKALVDQDRLPVSLIAWGPSDQYWADRALKGRRQMPGEDLDAWFPGGLLHVLGRSSQQLHVQLIDAFPEYGGEMLDAPDVAPTHLLGALQAEARDADAKEGFVFDAQDVSLLVHGCPGRVRMAEVVRDQVREAIESGIAPEDILILMVDPDQDALLLRSAFRGEDDRRRMPLRLFDGPLALIEPLAGAFASLLDIVTARGSLEEGLALLGHDAVADAYGLSSEEVIEAGRWLADAGIRWGWDAAHRMRLGRGGEDRFSWAAGLQRLMLGALTPDVAADALDVPGRGEEDAVAAEGGRQACLSAPLHRVAGLRMSVLRQFTRFASDMSRMADEWGQAAAPPEWLQRTQRMAALLTGEGRAGDEESRGGGVLQQAIGMLADELAVLPQEQLIAPEVFRQVLRGHMQAMADKLFHDGGHGVRAMSLRRGHGLPVEAVFVMGLDAGRFPERTELPGFHPLAHARQTGDRSPRDADRQWLLEAVLTARVRLGLFYDCGMTDTEVPPSPALADVLAAAWRVTGPAHADRLHLVHPRLPVSRAYFEPSRPAGLMTRLACAHDMAEAIAAADAAPPAVDDAGGELHEAVRLGAPEMHVTWDLGMLRRWLALPCRAALQAHGLRMPDQTEMPADEESQALEPLERWQVRERLLQDAMAGQDAAGSVVATGRRRAALGRLPQGRAGFRAVAQESEAMETVLTALSEPMPAAVPVAVSLQMSPDCPAALPQVRLTGLTRPMSCMEEAGGRVWRLYSASDITKGTHRLRAWLDVLALAAHEAQPQGTVLMVHCHKGEQTFRMPAQDTARRWLSRWMEAACLSDDWLLPWVAEPCMCYVRAARGGARAAPLNEAACLRQAEAVLREGDGRGAMAPEWDRHPELRVAFGGTDPLRLRTPDTWTRWLGQSDGGDVSANFFAALCDHLLLPVCELLEGEG